VGSYLKPVANTLYDIFIGRWLWMLFRHGPLALGFWKGLSDQDICARIARNSESSDWVNPATGEATRPCENMIEREFDSFVVVIHSVMYVVTILLTVSALKQYCSAKLKARAKTHAYAKAIHLSQLQLQLQTGARKRARHIKSLPRSSRHHAPPTTVDLDTDPDMDPSDPSTPMSVSDAWDASDTTSESSYETETATPDTYTHDTRAILDVHVVSGGAETAEAAEAAEAVEVADAHSTTRAQRLKK
jgi:hypothetical protein